MIITLLDRYLGAMSGLACGDAVGTSVEFYPRGSFQPVTDMSGGGPFGLKAGQWTDDTSMALCLAESLLTKGEFDPADQMNRYRNWWQWGYLSSTGECFDIGITVRTALSKFSETGDPFSGSADPKSAGNGSLMRLAPIVLFSFPDINLALKNAADTSRTTHAAPEAIESCQLFSALLFGVLSGCKKDELLKKILFKPIEEKVKEIASGKFIDKDMSQIRGTGYCIESLEAALWCFFNTESFEEAVLTAANLGEDADTTAAIVGQIAGAFYGIDLIPKKWISQLALKEDILLMAKNLYDRFGSRTLS